MSGTEDANPVGDANDADAPSDAEPRFRVVSGHPSDAELAALTVVLLMRAGAEAPAPATAHSGWSAYARAIRAPIPRGPDTWRRSSHR